MRSALLPVALGPASFALLWCLDRLGAGQERPGRVLAWLDLIAQHPTRSTLALGLLWLALLLRPPVPEAWKGDRPPHPGAEPLPGPGAPPRGWEDPAREARMAARSGPHQPPARPPSSPAPKRGGPDQ